jgi:membrane protease YdiL (CAAX protease family)
MIERPSPLKPMGAGFSLAIFGVASMILFLETHLLIPALSKTTGIEPVIFWFIVAGLGMFAPLLIMAAFILKREGALFQKGFWRDRLRFHTMTGGDWIWVMGSMIVIGTLSWGVTGLVEFFFCEMDRTPPFMAFEPLTSGRYWILLIWLPYWVLNIMGEEVLWRGVMLPRQEVSLGRKAWVVHGIGWGIFHISFGWHLLFTVFPVIFILSYGVQRRKNTWVGVIIHAGINGPSFLAIAAGLL